MAYLDNKSREIRESEFLDKLNQVSARFYDIRKEIEHVLIITHTDADGYAAGTLVQQMCKRENIKSSIKYFNRTSTWSSYLNEILLDFDNYDNFAVFFTDIGAEVEEISNVFKNNEDEADVFILDHHEMEQFSEENILENIHVVNPTIYGYDGLKEIAGSTLVYMFTKKISLKNIQNAWIALIGISNDTLMNVGNYRSFNKMVLEEALSEEQIKVKDGLMVYGATHENVKNALAHSLFPYIKEISGNLKDAKNILEKIGIDSNKKVINLSIDEINIIDNRFPEFLKGKYVSFPKKKDGVLKHAFEHGLIISISAFKFQSNASKLIASTSAPAVIINEYNKYIKNLTKNLGLFVKTPKDYTKNVIFVDAGKRIPTNFWSDVASYASVNSLYNSDKALFLGGKDKNFFRFSVRCSDDFPPLTRGKGIDELIVKLRKVYGGVGGGHKLAGGYKIAPNRYKKMKNNIDDLFPL